ncbi:MAG: DNA mismatch repair endonuclease MutL [Ignavibacteriales bacterium]|nr:DNA mismatch repair endonuclease MutL [Ignavibacteriales bacterium]
MPSKIHILQPELANKIAAGEVVQRPASVVKELVENSLDANAKKINVIVKEAGKSFLQVIDDGDGLSPEDALLAFQRHATSKITTSDDLEAITTLGFRGEALASIAAVAQVEMKTRQEHDDTGTLVRIEGNELKENTKTGMERGTSITVKNLFYNTPARRNFLKTRNTELKNISDVVTRMAIAYPEVAWFYSSDDETLIDLKPASIEVRLKDLFGERQFEGLVKVHEKTEYLSLDGFIGKPNFARKSRVEQYLFINRRFIMNKAINHAVFHAYEHLLVKGMFPFYTLNITLDPHHIDVNVHPSKMEVKFENESNIYRFVLSVIRRTLGANDLIPDLTFKSDETLTQFEERLRFSQPPPNRVQPFGSASTAAPNVTRPIPQGSLAEIASSIETDQIDLDQLFGKVERRIADDSLRRDGEATFPADLKPIETPPQARIVPHQALRAAGEQEPVTEARAIWQIHNKYILSQVRTGLLIVDQHVAHERILYEKILANFENSLPTTQQLLFPHTVELNASDYSLVKELAPHLQKIGFDIKLFGKNTVVIEGIPADVRIGNEAKILQDVLDEFKNNEHNQTIDARDKIAKSFACKAAIKAGDKLNTTEMIVLIDQLFATSMPYVCPHGRPVVVKISVEELDRRFGRT